MFFIYKMMSENKTSNIVLFSMFIENMVLM